jgi:kynurenine formamidase
MALGIHKWHDHGVFAGRGVLIDYWAYAERHGKTYDATDAVAITYDELMACLAEQSQASIKPIEVRKGDILLVRSGFTRRYLELSDREEREHGHRMPPKTCGVAQDQRMLQFLWEKQVAVVGGDAAAWECLPPVPSSSFLYHEVLLAGWGCPIGELLWLEDLALACDEHKKWTFFLTSAPLNVPGGVASPANMVAIL